VPIHGERPTDAGLGLDKRRSKEAFQAAGVPVPLGVVVDGPGDRQKALRVPLPVMVKPLYEGSSKGIPETALCESPDDVLSRVDRVLEEYRQPALVEEFLPGREFTCAIVGNGASARALPLVEIRFDALPAGAKPIYGYEAKWVWDTPDRPLPIFQCPAPVNGALEKAVVGAAMGAYHALGCRDWSRVDVRLDAAGVARVWRSIRCRACFPTRTRTPASRRLPVRRASPITP
jgi:D-alanine-D-alanine ligase